MRILLILGGLRIGYGIDPDKTISPNQSLFIGGKEWGNKEGSAGCLGRRDLRVAAPSHRPLKT